jgi:hypothetical protein
MGWMTWRSTATLRLSACLGIAVVATATSSPCSLQAGGATPRFRAALSQISLERRWRPPMSRAPGLCSSRPSRRPRCRRSSAPSGGGATRAGAGGPYDTFTVPPCRIVDTRIVGGPLPASGSRDFHVTGSFPSQGGQTNCRVPFGPGPGLSADRDRRHRLSPADSITSGAPGRPSGLIWLVNGQLTGAAAAARRGAPFARGGSAGGLRVSLRYRVSWRPPLRMMDLTHARTRADGCPKARESRARARRRVITSCPGQSPRVCSLSVRRR